MNRRSKLTAVVVVAALMVVSGLVSYRVLFQTPSSGRSDNFDLQGYAVIKAYHANGTLYATWQGHNSLYVSAVNAIAQCMSGESDTPNLFGTCSPMTPDVWVEGTQVSPPAGVPFFGTAANILLPTGCSPTGNPPTCTGWQTSGTITFSTGPPDNPVFPISLNSGGASGQDDVPFDTVNISPTIVVNAGDSLVITVTFSIS